MVVVANMKTMKTFSTDASGGHIGAWFTMVYWYRGPWSGLDNSEAASLVLQIFTHDVR
jgi:hypothetical protein